MIEIFKTNSENKLEVITEESYMAKDFDPSAYEQTVGEVYRNYPTKVLLERSLIRMKSDH